MATARDRALIRLAQNGHVESFAELYDRHASRVLAVARRRLGWGCDADDLLHDVFLEAWQNIREYDPARASVATWLCVRARSRAADRLARRRAEVHACQMLTETNRASAQLTAATDVLPEALLATRTAVTRLEKPLRRSIELMYVAGLTAPEIAAQTGTAEGTVRSRLGRGLHKLQRALR